MQTAGQLTPDQRPIALFWADNPGQTFTPPGHWALYAVTHYRSNDEQGLTCGRSVGGEVIRRAQSGGAP